MAAGQGPTLGDPPAGHVAPDLAEPGHSGVRPRGAHPHTGFLQPHRTGLVALAWGSSNQAAAGLSLPASPSIQGPWSTQGRERGPAAVMRGPRPPSPSPWAPRTSLAVIPCAHVHGDCAWTGLWWGPPYGGQIELGSGVSLAPFPLRERLRGDLTVDVQVAAPPLR